MSGVFYMMEKNKIIIVFPIVDYLGIRQRSQQMMSIFGKLGYKVYHICPSVICERNKPILIQATVDINVFRVIFPYSIYCAFRDGETDLLPDEIVKGISLILTGDEDEVLLWVNSPYWYAVVAWAYSVSIWPRKKVTLIYDILDYFFGFNDLAKREEFLWECHNLLLPNADIVLYTAESLKQKLNLTDGIYVPNACNIEDWELQPLANRKGYRAGYFGVMSSWFDAGIINSLLTHRNGLVDVCLIGHMDHPEIVPNIIEVDNLEIMEGIIEHSLLKSLSANWACGIIPFRKTELTDCTDPVKLYEYYAQGFPVIATKLDELELLKQTVPYLVISGEDFYGDVEESILLDTDEKRRERREWAAKNTWKCRVETVLEVINA